MKCCNLGAPKSPIGRLWQLSHCLCPGNIHYLNQNHYMNIHTKIELAFRHSLTNLIQRSFTDLQLNFEYFYDNGRDALMQYSPPLVQGTTIYNIYVFLLLLVFGWQTSNFVFYSSLPARKRVVYVW